jgi:hypothetical protein
VRGGGHCVRPRWCAGAAGGRRRTDLGSVGAAVPGLFVDPEREAVGSAERGEEPGEGAAGLILASWGC